MDIPLDKWLKANGRKQTLPGDKWYADFASLLLPAVRQSALFKERGAEAQEQATLALTLYFRDAIAQHGGWTRFAQLYRQRYSRALPFYSTDETYVDDEINLEDIALVLWTQAARPALHRPDDYTLFSPEDERLTVLSGVAYDLMDASFEDAPVIDTPSADWMEGTASLRIAATPLPDARPSAHTPAHALRCLEHSDGYPLLYFADYAELCRFFTGVLGWEDKPSNLLPDLACRREFVIYANAKDQKLRLLLRNFKLSDDIAFRFSNQSWNEWPLTVEKYVGWLSDPNMSGDTINLFMDYETFGEHQWAESGIFDFMRYLPGAIIESNTLRFATPSEVAAEFQPVAVLHSPYPISWADEERDVTAWLGNELQNEAFTKLYALREKVYQLNSPDLNYVWRFMQSSDHFYYMATKWFSDGDVHSYFNPYGSPYEAFVNYMNVLSDFEIQIQRRLEAYQNKQAVPA